MENGTVSGASCVGGILGAVSVTVSSGGSLTVEECINYADVTGTGGYAAGIAGSAAGSSAEGFAVIIRRCGNEGTVFSNGPDAMYTGGIVGHDTGIYNILESLYNAGSVTGTAYVGGIAGAYNSAFENPLEDVYNVGTVTGSGDAVGGLIGYTSDANTIRNAYSAGRVTEEGTSSLVGIIAGSSSKTGSLTVDNVYYTDTLTGSLDGAGDMYLYGSTGSALTVEEIAAMAQTPDELRRLASVLGESFMFNSDSIYHAGYPVLTWEEVTGTGTYRQYVLGDVNGDGSVTVHDVTWLERYVRPAKGVMFSRWESCPARC